VTEDDLLTWFSRFGTVTGVKVRRRLRVAPGLVGGGAAQCAVGAEYACGGGRGLTSALQWILLPAPPPPPPQTSTLVQFHSNQHPPTQHPPTQPPPTHQRDTRSCTTPARCTSPRRSGAAASTALSTTPRRQRRRALVWMDGVELPELMKDNAGIIVQYAKPAGAGDN